MIGKDNYLEWLKNRKKNIVENVNDEFFRKILLEIHNDYAEQYICLKGEQNE